MAKTRNIPYSTRVKMQVLHEEGCNYRQIATRCGCRHTTARIIIKIFLQSGSLKEKSRIGRPRCSTARDDRVLIRLCWTDRKKAAPELKRQYDQMSPGSRYIQPEQMSESEGDVGKNVYLLALLQLWNMEEEHNGLRMHECWKRLES